MIKCTIAKNGVKYYYKDGKRISEKLAKQLRSRVRVKRRCISIRGRRKTSRRKTSRRKTSRRKTSRRKTRTKSEGGGRGEARRGLKEGKTEEKEWTVRQKKRSCISRSAIPLRDFQKRVVTYLDKKNKKGILVVHGTGTGKTLSAVTASQCYLDRNPKNKVIFVAPTSLLKNFKKELESYKNTDNLDKYHYYSFNEFLIRAKKDRPVNCKNTMLIIDEAHNLRNYNSRRYLSVFACAAEADKRLLLTATPFVNNMQDFIPLINFLYGKKMVGTSKEQKDGKVLYALGPGIDKKNLKVAKGLLKGKVDFVQISKSDKDFPSAKEHYLTVRMTPEYKERYDKLIAGEPLDIIFKQPAVFYNAHRRAVNMAGEKYFSLKLDKILSKLKKGKALIYTNWIKFGIDPIEKVLKKKNISYRSFHGSLSKKKRAQIVDDFNKNKFKVLIVTKAGGEGLDLKGVRNVFVLEPVWNEAGLKQIIGRAIRYKSHAHLPEKERKVDVWKLILIEPYLENWKQKSTSGDAILYQIINKKAKINKKLTKFLKSLSIEKKE